MQTRPRPTKRERSECIAEAVFLGALQDGGSFSADYVRLYEEPDTLPAANDKEAYQRKLARFVSGDAAEPETGAQLVSQLLRAYTDEWLETGITPDGVECPFERKLTTTRQALAAVKQYEYANLSIRIDWDHGLEHHSRSIAERLRASAPAKAVRPSPSVKASTGRPELDRFFEERQRRKLAEAAELGNSDLPRDVVRAARLRAAMIFHAFMQAPWRYKLGKCKRCFNYFVLQNKPPTIYRRGMYCPACKNNASAVASNNARRAAREERLMELAADLWFNWRPTSEFGGRNRWVAYHVNQSLGKRESAIAQNWVTRNEREIEKRAKQQRKARQAE